MKKRRPGWLTAVLVAAVPALGGCVSSELPRAPLSDAVCPEPGSGVVMGGVGRITAEAGNPQRAVVLMGGGREDDRAALIFAEAAGGGDVVVLRASGSLESYPNYFSGNSGVLAPNPAPASVVTLLLPDGRGGDDPGVLCRVGHAEAVWIAGGDQWDYLGRWGRAVLHSVASKAGRHAVGGTSAGAMILGGGAFSARTGAVGSAEALSDPLALQTTVVTATPTQPELERMLIDTHFTQRDREGRLLVFLAILGAMSESNPAKATYGVGIDERAALVIRGDSARVYAPAGRGVHLYEFSGSADLLPGKPLSMDGMRRRQLAHGAVEPWPPMLGDADEELVVEEGVVQLRRDPAASGPRAGMPERDGGRSRFR